MNVYEIREFEPADVINVGNVSYDSDDLILPDEELRAYKPCNHQPNTNAC